MLTPTFIPVHCLAAAVSLLLLAACQGESDVGQTEEGDLVLGRSQVQETVRRGVVPGERRLVIDGFNGQIRLDGTQEQTASLRFIKSARGEDDGAARERLQEITIEESGAEEEYVYRTTSDAPERTSVDVRGEVPQRTRLRVGLQSGTVALSGIDGPLDVNHSNGTVRVAGASENVNVETNNGAVEVGMRRVPPEAQVRLQTNNGDITLTLPAGTSARVEARTESGQISVEGLNFDSRQLEPEGAGARFTGRLGDGNAEITLRTQNGSITLREGTSRTLAPEGSLGRNGTARSDTARRPDAALPDTAGLAPPPGSPRHDTVGQEPPRSTRPPRNVPRDLSPPDTSSGSRNMM